MNQRWIRITLLLGVSLAACEGQSQPRAKPAGAPGPSEVEPGPIEGEPAPTPENTPVPLSLWVDDIIEHRSSDQAEPDTVDDKNVADTDDATAFDKYLD